MFYPFAIHFILLFFSKQTTIQAYNKFLSFLIRINEKVYAFL